MNKRIWFITGVSSGLGKTLLEAVVSSGDFVIGTFRNQDQVDAFNSEYDGRAVALQVDVTKSEQVNAAADFISANFDRLDIVVNNAGFGFAGAVEEADIQEVREVFEANFFGMLMMTQALLPILRKQGHGHIIQMSSQSGMKSTPGFGIYNASKFALEGLSEALAAEVAPLGIHVTLVEPGPFRTNFAGSSLRRARKTMDAYTTTAGAFRDRMNTINGTQEGDPEKAAEAIIQISKLKNPPLRLPLGKLAIATITAKLESVKQDLEANRQLAESAVFQ